MPCGIECELCGRQLAGIAAVDQYSRSRKVGANAQQTLSEREPHLSPGTSAGGYRDILHLPCITAQAERNSLGSRRKRSKRHPGLPPPSPAPNLTHPSPTSTAN